eukprot:6009137-Prymnesium_polylepis.2
MQRRHERCDSPDADHTVRAGSTCPRQDGSVAGRARKKPEHRVPAARRTHHTVQDPIRATTVSA